MKLITTIFLFFLIGTVSGQRIIKGTITDESGFPIPGVRIAAVNSTYGIASSNNGNYFLQFQNQDTIILRYRMIGFNELIDTVVFGNSTQITRNVVLIETATSLSTVEVYADKRDIAKEVIGKVIDNKKNIRSLYENYECNTYIKTSLEKEPRFPFLNNNSKTDSTTVNVPVSNVPVREKMNFIESSSITQFNRKSTYKETVLAHNDYSEKSSSSVVVSGDFSDPNSILPSQVVSYNPYIFFEKVQDGDFDLYQNLISLPKVSSAPLVSPVAVNAFINYKFTLNSVFIEDGYKIYDIKVEPRFNEAPLFSGSLFIIDSLWVIKSLDLTINRSAMEFFKDFRIIQDFELIDGNWIPKRREFIYTINDGVDLVLGNTRVHHTNYKFNQPFDEKTFKNVIMTYDEDAFNKDSAYWATVRPIKLKPEELKFIHEQDSITKLVTSIEYVDSVNAEYNRLRFWDFVLSGVGFRNREKQQEIYINPLSSQIIPFGIGGYRHRLGGFYSKEFDNSQAIKISGDIDYGFNAKDVKGDLEVEYTYNPRHFGSFKIRGGDIYDFVTMDQSVGNFFSRGNYVRKTFIGLTKRYEITNGLYGLLSYDYSTRRDISDVPQGLWTIKLGEIFNWPEVQPYTTYTVSIIELKLLYRFKQQYIIKGNKKLIVGTQFPELRMTYKKGIPGMFGSDVNFDFLEIGASDQISFGTFGKMKWDLEAGTFFGKTSDEVQFIERRFFRGSDLFFFSDPLNTLQLLDSTFNTTQPYLQAFVIHHFKGAILDKIPLVNKLKLELVAGAGALWIQSANYAHIEFYAGLERVFKIRKQLFKMGVFYVVRENNAASVNLNLKFGFDFFNSFTNDWSY